nr:MAG TPA: Prefoldin [Caudoviricetes sp.]
MDIKKKDVQEFEKIIGELDHLMQEIRSYNPEANLYVPMGSICLMKGASHSRQGEPQQENAVSDIELGYIGGGDW